MKEGLLKSVIAGIISTIIVQVIMFLISSIMKTYGLISIFDLLQLQLPVWSTLAIVVFVTSTIAFYSRSLAVNRQKKQKLISKVRSEPRYDVYEATIGAFDVDWHVLYGSATHDSEPYAFVESGPLCPKCQYEMDKIIEKGTLRGEKVFWHCLNCGKTYPYPEHIDDVEEAVEKLVEADFRRKKRRRTR